MLSIRCRRILASVLVSTALILPACTPSDPSPYAEVQEETSQTGAPPAVSDQAQQGGSFNRFFPQSVTGYDIVPAQEKQGFAEYKVNQNGKTVAMLAINDTTGTGAADKFQQSTTTLAGYPAVEQGQNATAILVNNRYQVKVLSRDASFTPQHRADWITKFDLAGLSRLQ